MKHLEKAIVFLLKETHSASKHFCPLHFPFFVLGLRCDGRGGAAILDHEAAWIPMAKEEHHDGSVKGWLSENIGV